MLLYETLCPSHTLFVAIYVFTNNIEDNHFMIISHGIRHVKFLDNPHHTKTLIKYKSRITVVYHVTLIAIGHGLLKKFWPLVLGCVLRTAGSSSWSGH